MIEMVDKRIAELETAWANRLAEPQDWEVGRRFGRADESLHAQSSSWVSAGEAS
jgi:hypothetical protein